MWFSKKGGSGMKKYQEALRRMYELLGKIPFEVELSDLKPLSELVNEKIEQESRKDKLILLSKWECIAKNQGSEYLCETEEIVTIKLDNSGVILVEHDEHDAYNIIPTEQFLLCFRPLKEGE